MFTQTTLDYIDILVYTYNIYTNTYFVRTVHTYTPRAYTMYASSSLQSCKCNENEDPP